jgi:hypothetical protein
MLGKSKFNGNIVSKITGLQGKELGGAMTRLKNNPIFSPEYVVRLSDDVIQEQIIIHLKDE